MNQSHRKAKKKTFQRVEFHDLQEYVNFQLKEEPQQERQVRRIPQLTQKQIKHRQELYMKSKFQFMVFEKNRNCTGNSDLQWKNIQQVVYCTSHELSCPICMSSQFEMIVPHITACGHIYCLPCYLRYTSISPTNTKCPLCGEFVSENELKSVRVQMQSEVKVGQIINLTQLVRNKISNDIYEFKTQKESRIHSRTLRVNKAYINAVLQEELDQLNNCLEVVDDELKDCYERSILRVVSQFEDIKQTDPQDSQIYLEDLPKDMNSVYKYYQNNDGQLGFLHPLCNKFLQVEYTEQQPNELIGELLQMEKFQVTDHTLKRYKFLSHIPIGADIIFFEIDMKNLLSDNNFHVFSQEMRDYRRRHAELEEQSIKKHKIEQKKGYYEQVLENIQNVNIDHLNRSFEFNNEEYPELFQKTAISEPHLPDKAESIPIPTKPITQWFDDCPSLSEAQVVPKQIQWGGHVQVAPKKSIDETEKTKELDFVIVSRKKKQKKAQQE